MRKLELMKTIQLLIFAVLAFLCIVLIISDSTVYQATTNNRSILFVCLLLWVTLFLSFFFIFLDFTLFTKQKEDLSYLDYAVHSDPLAKIANRSGCDEIIEKYLDVPLPDTVGCMMLELTSLYEVNQNRSRKEGNQQIRHFSLLLKLASVDICFVGRNGGNRFLAIFEHCNPEAMQGFLDRMNEKVEEYNLEGKNYPISFKVGQAFQEENIHQITDLIALSSHRLDEAKKEN